MFIDSGHDVTFVAVRFIHRFGYSTILVEHFIALDVTESLVVIGLGLQAGCFSGFHFRLGGGLQRVLFTLVDFRQLFTLFHFTAFLDVQLDKTSGYLGIDVHFCRVGLPPESVAVPELTLTAACCDHERKCNRTA